MSVAMLFAQATRHTQHQLYPFELIEPLLDDGGLQLLRLAANSSQAGVAGRFLNKIAELCQCLVTVATTRKIIFA